MIKSTLLEVNFDVGIVHGCSRPVGKDVESLVFLQTSHAEMNFLVEASSFGHQTLANKEQLSFLAPKWAQVTEVCNSSMRR